MVGDRGRASERGRAPERGRGAEASREDFHIFIHSFVRLKFVVMYNVIL